MRYILSLVFSFYVLYASDATIEVVKEVQNLPTIAVEDSSSKLENRFNYKIFNAIVSDLNVLSIFNVERNYSHNVYDSAYVNDENSKLDYVLRFDVDGDSKNSISAKIKLIQNSRVVMQKNYIVKDKEMYIFMVHMIAFDINRYLGAPDVNWMKKKVIFSRLTKPKQSEIVIADYTLTYQKVIIKNGLNVFPKWANKEQSKFYMTSLSSDKPTLYLIDAVNSKMSKIKSSDGMLVCSDVSSDGSKLLLTMAPNSQPDIYLYDVNSKKSTRLTTYSGIDVNGQFMENGKIAFISNRLGYPNVFSKKIGSKAVEQMVYYGKSNVSCSAYKNYIVYSARESSNAFSNNTFNLHLISTKSDFIRRLSATGVNEFPRFSDDGSVVLFVKNYKSQSSIGIVRLNVNKNYLFPLNSGKIQSMDW
ncbi:MAG: Tol-Pal system protein TolB [Campylobacterota bacterium]|nr:Tol-Pal system protein TolB [Campylobacterota bacterium]